MYIKPIGCFVSLLFTFYLVQGSTFSSAQPSHLVLSCVVNEGELRQYYLTVLRDKLKRELRLNRISHRGLIISQKNLSVKTHSQNSKPVLILVKNFISPVLGQPSKNNFSITYKNKLIILTPSQAILNEIKVAALMAASENINFILSNNNISKYSVKVSADNKIQIIIPKYRPLHIGHLSHQRTYQRLNVHFIDQTYLGGEKASPSSKLVQMQKYSGKKIAVKKRRLLNGFDLLGVEASSQKSGQFMIKLHVRTDAWLALMRSIAKTRNHKLAFILNDKLFATGIMPHHEDSGIIKIKYSGRADDVKQIIHQIKLSLFYPDLKCSKKN